MRMTIDEAILDLTELKICGVVPFTKGTISGGTYKVITEECLNMAINTMRKYQKIEEIVGNYGFDTSWICLKKIREVIEDGNDNK